MDYADPSGMSGTVGSCHAGRVADCASVYFKPQRRHVAGAFCITREIKPRGDGMPDNAIAAAVWIAGGRFLDRRKDGPRYRWGNTVDLATASEAPLLLRSAASKVPGGHCSRAVAHTQSRLDSGGENSP